MMRLDEHELELAHAQERRLNRDEEREHFDRRLQHVRRKPRYSRFRTLSQLWERVEREEVRRGESATGIPQTRAA